VASASLVLACSAPDAHLPSDAPIPSGAFVIATKADVISAPDPRAVLALSVTTGVGMDQLSGFVASHLSGIGAGEPRQQRLLADTDAVLARLMARLPSDELLAEDLRRAGDLLGDVLGITTTDDVLAAIFSRFCIGK
jgi:tRNA modification GTPase